MEVLDEWILEQVAIFDHSVTQDGWQVAISYSLSSPRRLFPDATLGKFDRFRRRI